MQVGFQLSDELLGINTPLLPNGEDSFHGLADFPVSDDDKGTRKYLTLINTNVFFYFLIFISSSDDNTLEQRCCVHSLDKVSGIGEDLRERRAKHDGVLPFAVLYHIVGKEEKIQTMIVVG